MKIQLTKTNIMICVLTLAAIVLTPVKFTWTDPAIEYLRFEHADIWGLVFWIYFAAVAGTCLASLVTRYDIAKLLGLLSLILIIILLFGTLGGRGLSRFLVCTNAGAYAYLVLTAVLALVTGNAAKKHPQ